MAKNDTEFEEEESLVMVDLSSTLESDFLASVKECKLLGVETDRPLLQLDNHIYSGQYEDTIGTCLLLEDQSDNSEVNGAAGSENKTRLQYKYLTNKKLSLQMTFLKKKEPEQPEDRSDPVRPEADVNMEPDRDKSPSEISTIPATVESTSLESDKDSVDTSKKPRMDPPDG